VVAAQKNRQTATAILLAAGGGSRFSGTKHKLLTVINGRSIFSWSLQHLIEANFKHVVVVTGAVDLSAQIATADTATQDITVMHNPDWQLGMASSLQCGIARAQQLGAESVVVGLADQPAILPSAWRKVGASNAPLAIATYNGVRGNPVRLHAEIWPLLPTTGDEGARSLFKSHRDLVEEIACEGSAQDLDTTEDLDLLTKLLGA